MLPETMTGPIAVDTASTDSSPQVAPDDIQQKSYAVPDCALIAAGDTMHMLSRCPKDQHAALCLPPLRLGCLRVCQLPRKPDSSTIPTVRHHYCAILAPSVAHAFTASSNVCVVGPTFAEAS